MRIAFIVATSIVGIIFLVWLSVLGVRFGNIEEKVSETEGSSLYAEVSTGFSEVFETGKKQINETRQELEIIFQQ